MLTIKLMFLLNIFYENNASEIDSVKTPKEIQKSNWEKWNNKQRIAFVVLFIISYGIIFKFVFSKTKEELEKEKLQKEEFIRKHEEWLKEHAKDELKYQETLKNIDIKFKNIDIYRKIIEIGKLIKNNNYYNLQETNNCEGQINIIIYKKLTIVKVK